MSSIRPFVAPVLVVLEQAALAAAAAEHNPHRDLVPGNPVEEAEAGITFLPIWIGRDWTIVRRLERIF